LPSIHRLLRLFLGLELLEIADLPGRAFGDHGHRRRAAGAKALDVVEAELAVGGRLAVVDAQHLFEVVHAAVRAAQHAGRHAAHLDVVVAFAVVLGVVHGIEGDDRADLGRVQIQDCGELVGRFGGDVAVELPLDDVQGRHDGRTLPARRVQVHRLFDFSSYGIG
jgi:hypothetical protein